MSEQATINTGGGAAITGAVTTNGGNFIGRDFIQHIRQSGARKALYAVTTFYALGAFAPRPATFMRAAAEAVTGDAGGVDFAQSVGAGGEGVGP